MFKVLLFGLLILHGAIHVMGFVKSRDPAALSSLVLPVGKAWGVLWLVAAVVLVATSVLSLVEWRFWWVPAVLGVVLSQIAIVAFWRDAKFGTIANVVLLLAALAAFGSFRFFSLRHEDECAGETAG